MKNRRSFIATVASGSVGLALATSDPAAAQSAPAPVPVASSSDKPASFGSAALAATMRARFDSALTDADLQTIAKAIDANNDTAKLLNPKKKRLKNGDAPIVRFTVAGGEL
jgi:phage tail sheath gpL-like